MAAYGLIGGLGRGLSQAATMIQQGMSEDRATELQRMRDASIERRWKADSVRRDSERAEDVAFRNKQASTSADQFNRQQTSREKQVIESNLSGIMEQQNKAEQAIRKAYEKRMEMGSSPELENQMQAEIEASQLYYSERLHNMINSYGDNLKGTGYEYLLKAPTQDASEKIREPSTSIPSQPDEIGGLIGAITNGQATTPSKVSQQSTAVQPQDLTLSNLLKKWGNQAALPDGRTKEMNTGFIPRSF